MSFINKLRNSIARAISVKADTSPAAVQQDQIADRQEMDRRIRILDKQHATETTREPILGSVTTEDITNFSSKYARNAVAQLGCWSAMARGFTEFVKDQKSDKVDNLCLEFHAWNAAAETEMSDESTLETIAKLSQVKPAKGDKQTDAIIARVLHKSVDEVRADREAKALVATKKREDMIIAFNTVLWSSVYSEGSYSLSAERVMNKLEQTLLWMAGWDTTNPSALAAELLLIEADIAYVKQLAKLEQGAEHDYEEGVMCADTLTRRTA